MKFENSILDFLPVFSLLLCFYVRRKKHKKLILKNNSRGALQVNKD